MVRLHAVVLDLNDVLVGLEAAHGRHHAGHFAAWRGVGAFQIALAQGGGAGLEDEAGIMGEKFAAADLGQQFGVVDLGQLQFAAQLRSLADLAGGGNGERPGNVGVKLNGAIVAQDGKGLLGHELALGIEFKFAVAGQSRGAVGKPDLEKGLAFDGHVGVVAGVFEFSRGEVGGGGCLGDAKVLGQIPCAAGGHQTRLDGVEGDLFGLVARHGTGGQIAGNDILPAAVGIQGGRGLKETDIHARRFQQRLCQKAKVLICNGLRGRRLCRGEKLAIGGGEKCRPVRQ